MPYDPITSTELPATQYCANCNRALGCGECGNCKCDANHSQIALIDFCPEYYEPSLAAIHKYEDECDWATIRVWDQYDWEVYGG